MPADAASIACFFWFAVMTIPPAASRPPPKALGPGPASLYDLPAMLPARRTDPAHEIALQTALDRLTGGVAERPDTPDGWVTAVRRLPPKSADYAPFPDGVDPLVRAILRDRGIEQLYAHQAAAIA